MESKIPRLNKPLSRWKQIVIHDKSNQIKKVYNLDDNQRLKRSKRQPKRKLNIKELMLRKMLENKKLQNEIFQINTEAIHNELCKDFHENDLKNESEKSQIIPITSTFQSLSNELPSTTEINSENNTPKLNNDNINEPDKNDDLTDLFNYLSNKIFKSDENNSDDYNGNDDFFFY